MYAKRSSTRSAMVTLVACLATACSSSAPPSSNLVAGADADSATKPVSATEEPPTMASVAIKLPGVKPPRAKVVPHAMEEHGKIRTDNYFWLKERENPEVISYLESENAYFDAVMEPTEALQEKLYDEIVSRIKKDDNSVPYQRDGYYYYTRFIEDGEYPVHCRKKGALTAQEEVMLDGNELADGHDFFAMRGLKVSPSNDILAYGVDTVGRRFYTLHFKNLTTGETLADTIPNVTPNAVWANDNRTLFYTKQHPENLRRYRVYRHVLGTDTAEDDLVYEEADETFSSFVYKTRSKKYVMIGSFQTLSSEIRYLDADNPSGELRVLQPRQRDHEYQADHYGDYFYIRTNHEAKNGRLMKTQVSQTGIEHWEEVIPHREDVFLTSFTLFEDHMVVSERSAGLPRLRVIKQSTGAEHYLDFGEPAYLASPSDNHEFNSNVLRYRYTSMTTPWSVFDVDLDSGDKKLLKQDEVEGGFDSSVYVTERLHAPARDGEKIPVSVVYRKGLRRDGRQPLLLYAYGSYGATIDPTFNSARLSILDRGVVFAIAHIRGGQVLGRRWYDDGKLLKKKNTFTDFIDVGEFLIAEDYTRSERLFAMGGSAGGLLMGAIVNMRPDLFHGVLAHVPFVDVMTTMLDPDIPLTAGEWDEWGDPRKKDYYDYMLSYSPYDNVEAKDYPHLMVTTGLHDSQVQYWEPAKWVAKLRTLKTGSNRLLLHTNMDAGHGGATGRFKRHLETARDYAFVLNLAGITE